MRSSISEVVKAPSVKTYVPANFRGLAVVQVGNAAVIRMFTESSVYDVQGNKQAHSRDLQDYFFAPSGSATIAITNPAGV